mgnify:CR=1 FL=1
MSKAAVLWTGGKDSALSLFKAMNEGYIIDRLITFVPPNPTFLAHPLSIVQEQAKALQVPHYLVEIVAPFDKSYENAISKLKEEGIDTLITGDIAEVEGAPNWIRERSKPSGMQVYTPLWYENREEIIEELISLNFEVIFSCVKKTKLTTDWLGRKIAKDTLAEMKKLSSKNGLDICGENGEYHTLVLNCPLFSSPVILKKSWNVGEKGDLVYMNFEQ